MGVAWDWDLGMSPFSLPPVVCVVDSALRPCSRSRQRPAGRFGVISDRKNAKLPYVTACKYCYNVIYNSVPLFLIDKFSQILNKKTQNFSLCFTDENGKTTGEIIDMAISALDGNEKDVIMPEVFTRGHFTRGVE